MTFFLLLSRSQVELGDALIEDDTEEAHHGRAGQQERDEDEGRAGIERREVEERRDDEQAEQHRRRHGSQHSEAQARERDGDMIQRNEADGGHDPDADRVELLIAQAERRGKEPGQQHDRQVRQAARHGPPNDVAHEFALHARVIRLQREEE